MSVLSPFTKSPLFTDFESFGWLPFYRHGMAANLQHFLPVDARRKEARGLGGFEREIVESPARAPREPACSSRRVRANFEASSGSLPSRTRGGMLVLPPCSRCVLGNRSVHGAGDAMHVMRCSRIHGGFPLSVRSAPEYKDTLRLGYRGRRTSPTASQKRALTGCRSAVFSSRGQSRRGGPRYRVGCSALRGRRPGWVLTETV